MEFLIKIFSRYYNLLDTFKNYRENSEDLNVFDTLFEKYNDEIQEFLKKYNLEERFKKAIESHAIGEIAFIFFELIINALKDKELRNFLLELWKASVENFEDLLYRIPIPILDTELYFNIKPLIEEAAKINFEQVSRVLLSYFKVISEKIPVSYVYKSLNVNIEHKMKNIQIIQKFGIDEGFDKIINIDKLIEEAGEKEFKIYLFDWALKFGYILEAHIKNILIFILNLYYIKTGVSINTDYYDVLSIGEVLNAFKNEEIWLNRILKHYRNAIFHSNFFINYDLDLENREICISVFNYLEFIGKKVFKTYKIKIAEFFSYFYRMIMLANTFDIVLATTFAKDLMVEKLEVLFENIDELLEGVPKLSAEDMKKLFDEYRNKIEY